MALRFLNHVDPRTRYLTIIYMCSSVTSDCTCTCVPQYNYGYTGILPITTTSTHCTHHYMCVMTLTLLFLLHQYGETALDNARMMNRTEVVAYLEELGESIVYYG